MKSLFNLLYDKGITDRNRVEISLGDKVKYYLHAQDNRTYEIVGIHYQDMKVQLKYPDGSVSWYPYPEMLIVQGEK